MTCWARPIVRRFQFLRFMKHYRQHHSQFYRGYQRIRHALKNINRVAEEWGKEKGT